MDVRHRETTLAGGLRLIHKRYPAGLTMGRHSHDEWRYCLAVRGSYTDSWRRGARTRMPSHLSLHPANESHTSVFHTDATCFHIEYGDGWRDRLLGQFGIAPEPLEFLDGRVPLIAQQLLEEFRRSDACSPLVLEGLACELIGWTARTLDKTPVGPPWVHSARELLHDRFNESLDLKGMGAELDVHPVHLARTFRAVFGCTIGDYVRRLRVDFACRQLESGAAISDVALRAGFADQSHLTRVFKRVTGLTPHQFRTSR
ncbi:MAG: AraC family transcriptional regulator [bacterium]